MAIQITNLNNRDKSVLGTYGRYSPDALLAVLQSGSPEAKELVAKQFDLGYTSNIRNYVKSGHMPSKTCDTLKDFLVAAKTAAESRGGNGEALTAYRLAVAALLDFAAASLNKNAKALVIIKRLTNVSTLVMSSSDLRGRMQAIISSWGDSLNEAELAQHGATLAKWLDACEGMDADDEADF